MNFNYNELLKTELYNLQPVYGLDNYEFEVDSEQAFLKRKDLKPNTIYVLTKELQNDNSIGVDTQPVQILILTEQNSLEISKAFFTGFAKKFNFQEVYQTYTDEDNVTHNIWIKQQYSDPVVMSNFNTIDYGYRSVLYMSATLYIMYDIVDLKVLKIDGKSVKALTFSLAYTMTPNTQQVTGSTEFISKSVKSISSLAINLTIPTVQSDLISKVLSIANETDTQQTTELTYGGNENFNVYFELGNIPFGNSGAIDDTGKVLNMKLVALNYETAINNIPAIRLGFTK